MTLDEAVDVLQHCDFLKITANHVHATRRKTRAELAMLTREEWESARDTGYREFYKADVLARRGKRESLAALLIRAATLVSNGHRPAVRTPAQPQPADQCACGVKTLDLVWNEQLKQRLCRRCDAALLTAAKTNDMRPLTNSTPQ